MILNELYKANPHDRSFLFGDLINNSLVETFPFLSYYQMYFAMIDNYMIKLVGYRDYLYSTDNITTDLTSFHNNNLTALFANGNALSQLFKALETKYNPLENYDRTELTNMYDMFGKVTSHVGNDTATTTNGNTTNDSTTFYDTTKTVTDTIGRTDSVDHHHDKHKTESHVHGNIGVTTNVQMASQEVDFRRVYNFYQIMFDMLINNHTYYSDKGVDVL